MPAIRKIFIPLFLLGFGLTAVSPTAAEGAQPQSGPEMQSSTARPAVIDRANDIMAREVVNEDGEHLGYSKDLIINENGCIAFLVMLRGSAFGVIGPLIPVPWSMVTLQTYDKPLLIRVEPEVIRKAPGFTLDMWPDFFSPDEQEKINQHFSKYLK